MEKNISYPMEASNAFFEIEDKSYWFRQRNILIQHFVSRFLKPGNFVDVGGGNGYVSSYLAKTLPALDIILLEPSEEGCINASKRGIKSVFNIKLQDFQDPPLFENIGIFDVIEHVEDDEAFLRELYSRVVSGGKVFLTTPAYKFLWSDEDVKVGHFRRYTIEELHSKAQNAGFKVEESLYFFSILIPLIFLFRTIPFYLGAVRANGFSSDHRESIAAKCLEKLLKLEMLLIEKGFRLPFGASIFVCLKK